MRFVRKVFPEGALFNDEGGKFVTGNYEGFATTRAGYAHYLGDIGVDVKYVYVITNCKSAAWDGIYISCSTLPVDAYMVYPYPDSFIYYDEQDFVNKFYWDSWDTGNSGTVVVYTVLCKAFSNRVYPDFEKIAY